MLQLFETREECEDMIRDLPGEKVLRSCYCWINGTQYFYVAHISSNDPIWEDQ